MTLILQLLDATVEVLQHEEIAKYLAKNKQQYLLQYPNLKDPMIYVHKLCYHLHIQSDPNISLELMERITLQKQIGLYMESYRHLLDVASTPLPYALVQMGRAFLFLWTFSMPLVLLQSGSFTDLGTAMVFLFFLTYGFIGLELVSMKLASPFGDGIHDIQVTNLRDVRIYIYICLGCVMLFFFCYENYLRMTCMFVCNPCVYLLFTPCIPISNLFLVRFYF